MHDAFVKRHPESDLELALEQSVVSRLEIAARPKQWL
jgi:hypothetical protein